MSQILKAKHRILNRGKILTSSQQPNQQNNDPMSNLHTPHQPNQQYVDPQPVTTYNKKFNLSSISMKFTRNQDQQHLERTPSRFESIKLNPSSNLDKKLQDKRREISPQFSHTERINPIRHFEPYNLSTLSESNSHSNLYKWQKNKSRRFKNYPNDDEFEKRSDMRTTLEKPESLNHQSPINKIKKTIHTEHVNLLISNRETKRAQSPYKPRECIKEWTENFVKDVEQKGRVFIDEAFPPRSTIMYPRKSLNCEQEKLAFDRLPKVYQNMDLEVVVMQKCEPTLINPGKYSNPCLYSALRILSEYPQRVASLFENQNKNNKGIYYVRICKDGVWRYVIIDDQVPIRIDQAMGKTPEILVFNWIDSNGIVQMWPSLIEKALAKIYGTYFDLFLSRRDGLCPLLRALTGFPVSKYDLIKDVRSYLVLIDSALKRDHIVVLEEILPEFQYLAELKGLAVDQSYQVLQIQKNSFLLRNLADIDLITRLTFDEVMMFSSLLLFRKQENYYYISQKLRHRRGYFSSVRVKIPSATQCYWDVWQNNPAYYKNHLQSKIQYEVAPYKIQIQPLVIQSVPQYDSVPQTQTIVQSGKQVSMKKGEYLISVHLCQSMKEMDYTLSYYGEREIEIQRVRNKQQRWGEKCCEEDGQDENL